MAQMLFVVSDATGETGERVLRSALAQFPDSNPVVERFGGMREPEQVRDVVTRARENEATILHTLVSHDLRRLMLRECRKQGVDAMDLMGPVLDRLAVTLRAQPQEQPGLFEQLRAARARVIEAVDFAFRHDDGQHVEDVHRAEIVLVGVSRTMKTPLCLYLAHRGWFAANVPVVPELPLPPAISRLPPRQVFGVTMHASRLLEIRKVRAQYLKMSEAKYAAFSSIRDELRTAEKIFRDYGWNVVDVTGKSVEEVARSMIDLRGLEHE